MPGVSLISIFMDTPKGTHWSAGKSIDQINLIIQPFKNSYNSKYARRLLRNHITPNTTHEDF